MVFDRGILVVVDILEHVWSGTIERRDVAELSPLAQILSSLLAAPTLCLITQAGKKGLKPFASYGGCEVMPGASLADVLDEELGIEISDETIVLVEPRAMSDADYYSGKELGQVLGSLLVDLSGLEQGQLTALADRTATQAAPAGQDLAKGRLQAEQMAESHVN